MFACLTSQYAILCAGACKNASVETSWKARDCVMTAKPSGRTQEERRVGEEGRDAKPAAGQPRAVSSSSTTATETRRLRLLSLHSSRLQLR
jgi:hypothetical protein